MILQATAIGQDAKKHLEQHKQFYVHSVFNKGFNIVNKSNDLIFIGTDENGTFPFGILVDSQTKQSLFNEIELNQQIVVGPTAIQISKTCQLVWHAPTLKASDFSEQTDIQKLKENIASYDFQMYEQGDFNKEKMQHILNALEFGNDEQIEEQYRYLIGRGQGLTPSGDDMLTGILFIHFIHPFINNNHLEQLNILLQSSLTTLVGEKFLKCALQGQFSSKISNLQHDPSITRLDQLLKVGSSSGRDTLYGMYVALTLRSETYG